LHGISPYDGFAKSPSAALRFAVQGLDVQTVRLALTRLARLAYGAFCEAVGILASQVES
jgi:hypothetical protein